MNYRVLKTKQILDHLTQLLHSQVWRLRPLGARWILWVARRQVFHPNSGPEYGASWFIALLEWPWTFESSFWNVRLVISVGHSQTKQQHLWPSLLVSLAQYPWLSVGNVHCLLCDSGRDDNVNSSCFSLWRASPPTDSVPRGAAMIREDADPWAPCTVQRGDWKHTSQWNAVLQLCNSRKGSDLQSMRPRNVWTVL